MPNRDWLYGSLNDAFDRSVARQQWADQQRALQDAQDKGATIEETMFNVHDRLHPEEAPQRQARIVDPAFRRGDMLTRDRPRDPAAAVVPAALYETEFRDDVVTKGIQNFLNHTESM